MAQDKNNPDDDNLFRQMMADVKPLQGKKSADNRIPLKKSHPPAKRPAPLPDTSPSTSFALREHVPEVAPEEHLLFARSGLQHRLLRQLKRGELRPEAQLDLHGHTIAEAASLLSTFLHEAQQSGLRCIRIVHGKGHRSTEGRPVLKTQLNQWLRDTPTVLAFSSAQPKDGGMGAMYVLLRRES